MALGRICLSRLINKVTWTHTLLVHLLNLSTLSSMSRIISPLELLTLYFYVAVEPDDLLKAE